MKITPAMLSAVMSALGKRSSPAKARASRENGKKGGRPPKPVRANKDG